MENTVVQINELLLRNQSMLLIEMLSKCHKSMSRNTKGFVVKLGINFDFLLLSIQLA